jgi:hypothetical protein
MTKNMVFVFRVWVFKFFFYYYYYLFFMDDLELNDITLILNVDMNASVSIETHVKCDKPFILIKNDKGTYLKLI